MTVAVYAVGLLATIGQALAWLAAGTVFVSLPVALVVGRYLRGRPEPWPEKRLHTGSTNDTT